MINYLILHLLFIVYALNTVLGRMAAPYSWTDWHRFALLAGVLFLLATIFSPLFLTIPSFATAPALIIVGFYMMGSAIKIDFNDPSEGIPAFLTILAMPTAYSISEGIAIGVISVLREKGLRVPEDYSVCGFDNIFTSSIITPPLTSIDHRLWARCRSAVDQIVKQNDQGHGADKSAVMADKIEYAPQLMIRKSTGPARTSD